MGKLVSLAMSTSFLKALPGTLDIKRHSPSILYISASLAMSTSVLKALPGTLDIKRHSPSILYISASLAMSTNVLKALPGTFDIKRHSPSTLYVYVCIYEINVLILHVCHVQLCIILSYVYRLCSPVVTRGKLHDHSSV